MSDTPARHVFVWVDIPIVDLDRALTFYSALIGEPVNEVSMPGFRFGIFPHSGTSVSGCLYTAHAHHNAPSANGPLVYVNVDGRMAQAVEAVSTHGGRVEEAPAQIGEHGFRALVIDSEGNRIALHANSL